MDVAIAIHVDRYCPTLCGPSADDTCEFDAACGRTLGDADGCNAGGMGAQCRWCGTGGAEMAKSRANGTAPGSSSAAAPASGGRACAALETKLGQLMGETSASFRPAYLDASVASSKVQVSSAVSALTRFALTVHGAAAAVIAKLQQAAQIALCKAADEDACSVRIEGGVASAAPTKCAAFDGPDLETELHGADLSAMQSADDGECCTACEEAAECTGFVMMCAHAPRPPRHTGAGATET